jgi:hypothetical protein
MSGIGSQLPHRLIVLPFLRGIGQRFIMPEWAAITIGRWIFSWRQLTAPELAHELVHVRQWRENGFLQFIVRYLRESQRAAKAGLDRYRDNKFEIEARKAEVAAEDDHA